VVVVLEVRTRYPFLVVESDGDLDRPALGLCKLLLWDFFTTPEPSQRRYDALEALPLSIPVSSDFTVSSISAEFDSLDG